MFTDYIENRLKFKFLKQLSEKYLKFYQKIQQKILSILEIKVESDYSLSREEVKQPTSLIKSDNQYNIDLKMLKSRFISNEEYIKRLDGIVGNLELKMQRLDAKKLDLIEFEKTLLERENRVTAIERNNLKYYD
jgi:hypothetical protein